MSASAPAARDYLREPHGRVRNNTCTDMCFVWWHASRSDPYRPALASSAFHSKASPAENTEIWKIGEKPACGSRTSPHKRRLRSMKFGSYRLKNRVFHADSVETCFVRVIASAGPCVHLLNQWGGAVFCRRTLAVPSAPLDRKIVPQAICWITNGD